MGIYEKGYITIGTEIMVSDPCYKPGTWCQGVVKDMIPDQYLVGGEIVDVDGWGRRISKIWILHEDFHPETYEKYLSFNFEDFEVGVDSGQAGIYDYNYYLNNAGSESWYSAVCDLTYTDNDSFSFGSLDDRCVVSSSGLGDGCYSCTTGRTEDGRVAFVQIDYDVEDDEYEYDEDDSDYDYDDDYNEKLNESY